MQTHPAPQGLNPARLRRTRAGFALLITITLLAFMVLLLVVVASLTRVETQVAFNSQQHSQARQNALMALNIALGRLQATAGPDTRITATADIVSAHPDKKYWTGVWNADAAGADKNIAWLVSGSPAAGAPAVTTALPLSGVITLVGDNSTDITNTDITGNEIKVPTEAITANDPPGMSGPQIVGNFAYWVGDEGVKAKANLTDPWQNPAPATTNATTPPTSPAQANAYRFIAMQRMGIEGVGRDTAGTKLGTNYPATDPARADFKAALPNVLSLPQLPMANPAGQAALAEARRLRFHDLTTVSQSVLADAALGGLKQDLTAWIADSSAPPAAAAPIAASSFGMPTWGMIRSFATTTSGAPVVPRRQINNEQGVYPVITYARLGYNVWCPGPGSALRLQLFPALVLWNPYNVPIAAADYEFCFGYPNTNQQYHFFVYNPSFTYKGFLHLSRASRSGAGTPQFFRFPVTTRQLEPGESRIYTLADLQDGAVYQAGVNTLSDDDVALDNSVYVEAGNPAVATQQMSATDLTRNLYWTPPSGTTTNGELEVLLCPPWEDAAPPTADDMRNNAYQAIQRPGYSWTQPSAIPTPTTAPVSPRFYQRVELYMSAETYSGFGSQPRWLAQLNPQNSLALRRPGFGNPSYYADSYAGAAPVTSGGRASAGVRISVSGGTPQNLIVREFPDPDVPLFSLAQLQHANLSSLNINPAYAVGNSFANFYVNRTAEHLDVTPLGTDPIPSNSLSRIHDLSYVLNRALWDRYFFSTVPASLDDPADITSDYHLPNARHTFHWRSGGPDGAQLDRLKNTGTAAAHLLVNGGFNINSTSEQAWRALLYSHNGVAADGSRTHPFSRFADPSGAPNQTWEGYRILADEQLDRLAAEIVNQVRLRGPFLSLADFVNRRLDAGDTGLKGALQAAIDATDDSASAAERINAAPFAGGIYRSTAYSPGVNTDPLREQFLGASIASPSSATIVRDKAFASRATLAPGYLSQADVLTAIGPVLTARSDTFVIRTYGDTINPATDDIEGRAWCEAIVQRLPAYMDDSLDPETDLSTAPASPARQTNETFGRRFHILSFRWLSADDI